MTQDTSEAEDLTQDVFVHLFRTIGSFRGESAFTTWLHRLTVNIVLMHFRRRKVRRALSIDTADAVLSIAVGPLFTIGLIGTGMLAVPVLAGSAAYAISEAKNWHGSLEDPPRMSRKFYSVIAVSMILGLVLDFFGFNAVKMLFYSSVLNGLLAPPLIILVVLLTSNPKVMGGRVSSLPLRYLGWAAAVIMTLASVGMFATL